ncbi:MAG: ribose 5-phosphate isomerase B [Clostridia bacterium]|nr:ribose 5-phosphate isomerase B [Clostridia bacterium]
MRIYIGNDHGGWRLKKILAERLREMGHDITDVGSDSDQIVRYPYYAAKVAGAVAEGRADRGILICSTGIGMSMLANRFKGVRAALCTDSYMAKMTRRHNDSNVLCLGGKITGELAALDMMEIWLQEPYEGGRHDISLGLIREAEARLCADDIPEFENLFSDLEK